MAAGVTGARNRRMRPVKLAILMLLPLMGVIALALHQGDHARAKRLFAERVFYHRHLRPPEDPRELFALLGYRASEGGTVSRRSSSAANQAGEPISRPAGTAKRRPCAASQRRS